jgi:hypothetical protein
MNEPLVAHYLDVVDLMESLIRRRLPRWAMLSKGLNDLERRALAEKLAAAHSINSKVVLMHNDWRDPGVA